MSTHHYIDRVDAEVDLELDAENRKHPDGCACERCIGVEAEVRALNAETDREFASEQRIAEVEQDWAENGKQYRAEDKWSEHYLAATKVNEARRRVRKVAGEKLDHANDLAQKGQTRKLSDAEQQQFARATARHAKLDKASLLRGGRTKSCERCG